MHTYYISGFSYSDGLYHDGIKGMKHGVRRFQNLDRTWTEAGKIRYSKAKKRMAEGVQQVGAAGKKALVGAAKVTGKAAVATGKTIGKAAKTVGKYEIDKFKRNHPWLMTDAELNSTLDRAKKIDSISSYRKSTRDRTFGGKLSSLLWKSVGIGTDKLAENMGTKLGQGFAERLLLTEGEKKVKEINDRMAVMDKEEALYKKLTQDKLGEAKKAYYDKINASNTKEKASSTARKPASQPKSKPKQTPTSSYLSASNRNNMADEKHKELKKYRMAPLTNDGSELAPSYKTPYRMRPLSDDGSELRTYYKKNRFSNYRMSPPI